MPTSLHHRTYHAIVRILLLGLLIACALSAKAEAPTYLFRTLYAETDNIDPAASCDRYIKKTVGPTQLSAISGPGPDNYDCEWVRSDGYHLQQETTRRRAVCATGANPVDGVCPDSDPAMTKDSSCLKYQNLETLAAADGWVSEPRTFAYNVGANGVGTITGPRSKGSANSYTYAVDCYGKNRVTDGDGKKLPAPTPVPAPAVDTAYPKCGTGNYLYTDENGLSTCSQNLPDRTLTDCQSGNGGYVNGKATCLPANPAPTVAANAATTAQQKADAAVAAGRATQSAIQAANDAAAAYRRAAEAANSMPTSTAAQSSATTAYQSATQAAIAAGMAVPAPLPTPGAATGTGVTGSGPSGNGTGTENSGPKECGSPGKPACKIDETGTPDGKSAYDTAGTALDATKADITTGLDGAKSDAGKSADLGGWMPTIPPGSCTDPQVRNSGSGGMETVKICDKLPPITLGMELLWCAFFGYAIMGLISNAMSKS